MASELAAAEQIRVCAGDFDLFMRSEQRRVYLLCWRMLQDGEEADIATQDVFLKAYRALAREHDDVVDPGRWVTRIAVNTCLDRLRSRRWTFWRKRINPDAEEAFWRERKASEPDAVEQIFARQIARRLHSALARLSARQRAVFLLRHYEDRTVEEIAAILELDAGSVKSHMFRATAKLRQELKDLYQLGVRT
jgi:RNA polymerase sigma-70 factor (ECF subfamily)